MCHGKRAPSRPLAEVKQRLKALSKDSGALKLWDCCNIPFAQQPGIFQPVMTRSCRRATRNESERLDEGVVGSYVGTAFVEA